MPASLSNSAFAYTISAALLSIHSTMMSTTESISPNLSLAPTGDQPANEGNNEAGKNVCSISLISLV
jgi:hypothetical protein